MISKKSTPNDDEDYDLFDDRFVPEHRKKAMPKPLSEERSEEEIERLEKAWRSPYNSSNRKKSKRNSPENAVRRHVENYLDSIGVKPLIRTNSGTWVDKQGHTIQGATPGTSDYNGLLPIKIERFIFGVFLAVETKAPGKKATDKQQDYLDQVKANGGIACVAYSPLDIERAIAEYKQELIRFLKRITKPKKPVDTAS